MAEKIINGKRISGERISRERSRTSRTIRTIAVFGSGQCSEGDEVYQMASQIGRLLAEAGFTIINGGYGGTMLAAAQAAAKAGGKTIGVTCRAFKSNKANDYIAQEIATGSLDERLERLIAAADAYIVLPGATGTLLELALVWELKNKGFIKSSKPLILVGKFWQGLVKLLKTQDADCVKHIQVLKEPTDAVDFLKKFFA